MAKPKADREHSLTSVRLDKWLWAARFFKTRTQAAGAASGGKVHVNQGRGKPGQGVRVGDTLHITKGELVFEVEIAGLAERRAPAPEAAGLYTETSASQEARLRAQAARRTERLTHVAPPRRPDGKGQRRLRQLKRGD